jgi:hypothetical protein
MKMMQLAIIVLGAALIVSPPASGQILTLNSNEISAVLTDLHEIDFEDLPTDSDPILGSGRGIPNPLRSQGVKFEDPTGLSAGFCSSPTCEADPDNATGGNVVLFLNPASTISFAGVRRIVVLDLQGMGDEPFTLRVTDRHDQQSIIAGQARSFGVTLVGMSSTAGIKTIEVRTVGSQGEGCFGPLALARVLFSTGMR